MSDEMAIFFWSIELRKKTIKNDYKIPKRPK